MVRYARANAPYELLLHPKLAMKLYQFDDPNQFYAQVKDYLLNNEACQCLLLRIVDTLIHHPQRYQNPYLASVEVEGNVVAVAIRTPPYKLVLSKIEDVRAADAIASELHAQKQAIPGVSGLTQEALTFAQTWQNLTGQSYQLSRNSRIHQLQQVQPIARASGYLRCAEESDRQLLCEWFNAFALEIGENQGNLERTMNHHLSQKNLYLWQDRVPVSMAYYGRSTPTGKFISGVYTPPEYRRKGYATSCVATLSQNLLDRGNKYCLLFTDLSNPTSNHIYQTIGYQPVSDWDEYCFTSTKN